MKAFLARSVPSDITPYVPCLGPCTRVVILTVTVVLLLRLQSGGYPHECRPERHPDSALVCGARGNDLSEFMHAATVVSVLVSHSMYPLIANAGCSL